MPEQPVDFDPYCGCPSTTKRRSVIDAGRCLERIRFHLTHVYLLYSRPVVKPRCEESVCSCYELLCSRVQQVIDEGERHYELAAKVLTTLRAIIPQIDGSSEVLQHLEAVDRAFAPEGEFDRLCRTPWLHEDGDSIAKAYLDEYLEVDPHAGCDPFHVASFDRSDGTPLPPSLAARLASAKEGLLAACDGSKITAASTLFEAGRLVESVLSPEDLSGLISYRTPTERVLSQSGSADALADRDYSCERVIEGRKEQFHLYEEFRGRSLYSISRQPGDLTPLRTLEPRLRYVFTNLDYGNTCEHTIATIFQKNVTSAELKCGVAVLYAALASGDRESELSTGQEAPAPSDAPGTIEYLGVKIWKDQVTYNNERLAIGDLGVRLLRAMIKARGEFISASGTVSKPARVRKLLPKALRDLIEFGPKGYRLREK